MVFQCRDLTLYKRVLECVQRTLTDVRLFKDDFTQEMLMQDEASRKAELTQKRKVLSGAQKRMEDIFWLFAVLIYFFCANTGSYDILLHDNRNYGRRIL